MKNIFLVFVLCFLAGSAMAQQESQYTMSMFNRLYYNPAYAGVRGMPTVHALYRKQWFGYEGAPVSKLISFNAPLSKDRVGFGLTVSNHQLGITDRWNGSMAYSYKIQFNEETSLRLGVQGSMHYYGIDFSDPSVITTEAGDPSILENTDADIYEGNFGAGFYLIHKNFYFGGSSPSILGNELGFNLDNEIRIAKEAPHFYIMGGALFPLGSGFQFQPSFLGKYVKNAPPNLEVAANFIYDNRITTGIAYRTGNAGSGESVDLILLYQAGRIAVGLAYDFSLGELSRHTVGSLEVMVRYDVFKETVNMANPRFFY